MSDSDEITITMKRSAARRHIYFFEGGHKPDAVNRRDQAEYRDSISMFIQEALNEELTFSDCDECSQVCKHWRDGAPCSLKDAKDKAQGA